MKETFQRCKFICQCGEIICRAIHLKQCSVCCDIFQTQCHKKACKTGDGRLPKMIEVASKKENIWRRKKRKYVFESSDESDTETEYSDESESDQDNFSEEPRHHGD